MEKNFQLQSLMDVLSAQLSDAKYENKQLAETLRAEQDKNSLFEREIMNISGTVSTLQKLTATDPQLLQKYSKIYFLNENYIPAKLTKITSKYLNNEGEEQEIHSDVLPFLKNILEAAATDGITIEIVSAYRSFGKQASVKTSYKVLYGSGANQFSADQGYSEHQLGTALDLTSPDSEVVSPQFEKSAGYQWLTDNAHKFGFTLSYPKNNSYYQFESWHWRFVGKALATKLHDENKHLYDVDQREINQYLISIFD